MTDTIFRHMVYDGVPVETVANIQAEAMADEASVVGKELTDFTVVFDGTVDEAQQANDIRDHLPPFIVNKDYDERVMRRARVLVQSAAVVGS